MNFIMDMLTLSWQILVLSFVIGFYGPLVLASMFLGYKVLNMLFGVGTWLIRKVKKENKNENS